MQSMKHVLPPSRIERVFIFSIGVALCILTCCTRHESGILVQPDPMKMSPVEQVYELPSEAGRFVCETSNPFARLFVMPPTNPISSTEDSIIIGFATSNDSRIIIMDTYPSLRLGLRYRLHSERIMCDPTSNQTFIMEGDMPYDQSGGGSFNKAVGVMHMKPLIEYPGIGNGRYLLDVSWDVCIPCHTDPDLLWQLPGGKLPDGQDMHLQLLDIPISIRAR
jgi:hypothetical protein